MHRPRITAERLRALLDYDRETGDFRWRERKGRAEAGSIAGSPSAGHYFGIKIDGAKYWAHQLAFLHVTGAWPKHEVDHRDGVKHNNAWANLRDVPHFVNQWNKRGAQANNSTGLRGVSRARRRFVAQITMRPGASRHVGVFDTPEEAAEAYQLAARQREQQWSPA